MEKSFQAGCSNPFPEDNGVSEKSKTSASSENFRLASTQEEFSILETFLTSQPSTSHQPTGVFLDDIRKSFKQLRDERDEDECRIIELDEEIQALRDLHEQQKQILLEMQMQQEKLSDKQETEKENQEMMNLKMQEYQQILNTLVAYCESLTESTNQMCSMNDDIQSCKNELMLVFKDIETKTEQARKDCDEIQGLAQDIHEIREKRESVAKTFRAAMDDAEKQHKHEMSQLNAKSLENKKIISDMEMALSSTRKIIEEAKLKEKEISEESDKQIDSLQRDLEYYSKSWEASQAALGEAQKHKVESKTLTDKLTSDLEAINQRVFNLEADQADGETTLKNLLSEKDEVALINIQAKEELDKIITSNSLIETELSQIRLILEETREFNLKRISELRNTLNVEAAVASEENDRLNMEIASVEESSKATLQRCEQLTSQLTLENSKLCHEKEISETLKSVQSDLEKKLTEKKHEKDNLLRTLEDLRNLLELERENIHDKEGKLKEHIQLAETKTHLCQDNVNERKQQVESVKSKLRGKKEQVISLSKELEQLRYDLELKENSISNEFKGAINEATGKISKLENDLEKAKGERETFAQTQKAKIKQLEKELLVKEKKRSKAQKALDKTAKGIDKGQKDIDRLDLEIKEIDLSEQQLVSSVNEYKEIVRGSMSKLGGLKEELQNKERELLDKEEKLSHLKQTVKDLDLAEAEAISKLNEEMKMLHQDIEKAKQTSESLSETANQRYNEIDELKKKHATALTELEDATRRFKDLQKEHSKTNSRIDKRTQKLVEVKENLISTEIKLENSKLELKARKRELEKIIKVIAKAKEKQKLKPNSTNVKVPEAERVDDVISQDLSAASTSKSENTPRSILKTSSKPSTPQSANKKVNFSQSQEQILCNEVGEMKFS